MSSPLESDELLCTYLGIITARWGMMEEALCLLLGRLLDDEVTGRSIYFATGSFRQRIEALKAVGDSRIVAVDDFETFNNVLKRIYKAFQVRNQLIHSHYVLVVEDTKGERSAISRYFNKEISLDSESLKPLFLGRQTEDDIIRVNKGTFMNHGDKIENMIDDVADMISKIENEEFELGKVGFSRYISP